MYSGDDQEVWLTGAAVDGGIELYRLEAKGRLIRITVTKEHMKLHTPRYIETVLEMSKGTNKYSFFSLYEMTPANPPKYVKRTRKS
jgi:hypothetical protein